jgi:Rps23 Pro-64 3,4-dihydroxylase Tpa1-like proline 4-hydroxylase
MPISELTFQPRITMSLPPPPKATKSIQSLSMLDMHHLFFENQISKNDKDGNFVSHPHPTEMVQEDVQEDIPTPPSDMILQFAKIRSKVSLYRNEFETTRKVRMEEVLHPLFAEKLYQHIVRMPDPVWSVACGIRNIKYEKKLHPTLAKRNQDNINEANKTFGKGEFSYVFHRAMNNVIGEISQFETMMRTILNSQMMKQLLSEMTGLEITTLKTMFLSRYRAGHFLSPHSDKGNGKIAFVINLTKNWLPQYGGNLHFLSEDRTKIIETWTPAFNNMVIFHVPPEHEKDVGMPHFVGHVNPQIKFSRYAITGWYD